MERTITTHHPQRKSSERVAVQGRTKGETVPPVAVLQLIAKIGVTATHRKLGVSTTTLHKVRKPKAVVSKVIELAAEATLRELQMEESRELQMEESRELQMEESRELQMEESRAVHHPKHIAAPPTDGVAHKADRTKQLIIMKVPADRAEDLEYIARAWGAEFTKA